MGKSQNLRPFVCGGVSYSQVLPYYVVLSYTRVSTVCKYVQLYHALFAPLHHLPSPQPQVPINQCPVSRCTSAILTYPDKDRTLPGITSSAALFRRSFAVSRWPFAVAISNGVVLEEFRASMEAPFESSSPTILV